jgi:hypothetical protein
LSMVVLENERMRIREGWLAARSCGSVHASIGQMSWSRGRLG